MWPNESSRRSDKTSSKHLAVLVHIEPPQRTFSSESQRKSSCTNTGNAENFPRRSTSSPIVRFNTTASTKQPYNNDKIEELPASGQFSPYTTGRKSCISYSSGGDNVTEKNNEDLMRKESISNISARSIGSSNSARSIGSNSSNGNYTTDDDDFDDDDDDDTFTDEIFDSFFMQINSGGEILLLSNDPKLPSIPDTQNCNVETSCSLSTSSQDEWHDAKSDLTAIDGKQQMESTTSPPDPEEEQGIFSWLNFFTNENKMRNSLSKGSSEMNENVVQQFDQRNTKRLKLRKTDEIHASPCQCALKLMGMQGLFLPSPKNNTPKTAASLSLTTPSGLPPTPAKTTLSTKILNPSEKKRKSVGHVRTFSAEFGALHSEPESVPVKISHKKLAVTDGNRTKPKETGASFSAQSNQMSFSNMFASINYHEITLIRQSKSLNKGYQCDMKNTEKEEENEGFVPWSAVTIRCKDHDEMERLIKALKRSARATVVPFSPHPKAKLRKKQKLSSGKKLKGRRLFNEDIHTAKRTSFSDSQNETKKLSSRLRKKKKKAWNNNDYCELCKLNFTFLTRRHHCRKCDRSVCDDCSSIMLVSGGEETRYCNPCNAEMLRKHPNQRRHRRFDSSSRLGKVHTQCNSLGVGVVGMLPHWKSFLTFNPEHRPAVGRLTVEIIEALALPDVDLNGKSDPYVCATITGYDYDRKWKLREFEPSSRFSLSSSYCSSTLSPVWRGPGRQGGQLITLPVATTSGAVLRLEVKHFDVMSNARGNDPVLGVVEISLSDFPNANLRRADSSVAKDGYDGFVDRWYRLSRKKTGNEKEDGSNVLLATPIDNPQLSHPFSPGGSIRDDSIKKLRSPMKKFLYSMEEIGNRTNNLVRAPIDWAGSALGIHIPRHATSKEQQKLRSSIHVRIKLNVSEVGDLVSHTWIPPVPPRPEKAPFDPETTLSLIMSVNKKIAPYLKCCKFCENCVKWQHPESVCVKFYFFVIIHVFLFRHVLVLLHLYLLVFLLSRLKIMTKKNSIIESDESVQSLPLEESDTEANSELRQSDRNDTFSLSDSDNDNDDSEEVISESLQLNDFSQSVDALKLQSSSTDELENRTQLPKMERSKKEEDERARLGAAVSWLAKKIGHNRGLEVLQYKLEKLKKDLTNLNSLWDGNSVMKTQLTISVVCLSLILHVYINAKIIWATIITAAYFAPSPPFHRFVRMNFGLSRGFAKILQRRRLHLLEDEEYIE